MENNEHLSKLKTTQTHSMLSKVQRFSWTFRKWWWILLITAGLGICWAAWTDSKKPLTYLSVGRMMVSGKLALPEGVPYSEEVSMFYGTQSRLMESAKVRQRAAARVESTLPDLRASSVYLSVAQERGTSFLVLSAVGEEPNYTRAFLNACMEEYIRFKRDERIGTTDESVISLTDNLLKCVRDLDAGELELIEFKKKYNVAALGEEGNIAAKNLAQLNQKLANLKMELQLLSQLDVEQNIERKQQSATANGTGDNAVDQNSVPSGAEVEYPKAKMQMQLLRAEKDRRARYMRPKHPLMVQLDAAISEQEGLIKLYRDQNLAQQEMHRESLRKEKDALEASLHEWNERTLESTGRVTAYDRLNSQVENLKSKQKQLHATIASIELERGTIHDVLKVMDQASLPESTKPGLLKDLSIGALIGIATGLAIVFLIGILDDRITSSNELRERFPEPLLGHIPHEASGVGKRVSMLTVSNKQGIFVEAYRNLRSTLHFMSLEEPRPKAFLVTSAVPGEGKSTLAVNLGIILAGGGSRTLLIDADLRKGLLHSYFSVEAIPGLVEVLNGDVAWKDAVVETSVPNLSLLPRGKGGVGPGEFFLSDAADQFLREIYAAGYDKIIFDSAPILATDDTACLAPKIDATLFVVRAEASSMRLTRSALDALHKRQVNVLGLILNAANLRSSEYHYYQKYGDYYADASIAKIKGSE